MDRIKFHSYKPYLQISLSREKELFVTFGADCSYTPKNEEELQLLREYAWARVNSYCISEAMPLEELQREHEALEDRRIQEAEARLAAQEAAEKRRKEEHEFYSVLRMADKAYL
jgi:hypothetical protein